MKSCRTESSKSDQLDCYSVTRAAPSEPSLPFVDAELHDFQSLAKLARALVKPSKLPDAYFHLGMNSCTGGEKGSNIFLDKKLPVSAVNLKENEKFNTDYFVTLHKLTSAPGFHYPARTPNHLGARIHLKHTSLKIDRWRHHLIGYGEPEIIQYLEFGFPIGLSSNPPP